MERRRAAGRRVRADRGPPAGDRADGGPGGDDRVRLPGLLAHADRERDHRHLGALGVGRRAARARRHRALRHAVGGAGARHGGGARRRWCARARQPLGLRVQAGDGRLPVRPRPDDHPRPGAEAARRAGRQRPVLRPARRPRRPPRRHPLVDGRGGRRERGGVGGVPPARATTAGHADRARVVDRARGGARTRRPRRRPRRQAPARAPGPGGARRLDRRPRQPPPRRVRRDGPDRRGRGRRARPRVQGRLPDRPEPGARRDRRLQRARRPLVGLRAVRRREPDDGRRERRGKDTS